MKWIKKQAINICVVTALSIIFLLIIYDGYQLSKSKNGVIWNGGDGWSFIAIFASVVLAAISIGFVILYLREDDESDHPSEEDKKNRSRGEFLVIKILLYSAVIPPVILMAFRFGYDRLIREYDSNWFSFFGSYLGGLLGGVATLIAVVKTIQSNKKEQLSKEESKRQKEIQKSALIIYYDFRFAFDNIISFLNAFWDMKRTNGFDYVYRELDIKKDDKNNRKNNEHIQEDDEIYKECIIELNQFYFDNEWIHTVAMLQDPTLFSNEKIRQIYEIYGHLSNIKKSMESRDNINYAQNAFKSMNCLVKSTSQNVAISNFEKTDDINQIMDYLECIAFRYDIQMIDPNYVKRILDDLSDQLLRKLKEQEKSANTTNANNIEKAILDSLELMAKNYHFEFPVNKHKELTKGIQDKLGNGNKYICLLDSTKANAVLQRDIIFILKHHGYPGVPERVIDQIIEEMCA